jgi:hypothetical protein
MADATGEILASRLAIVTVLNMDKILIMVDEVSVKTVIYVT